MSGPGPDAQNPLRESGEHRQPATSAFPASRPGTTTDKSFLTFLIDKLNLHQAGLSAAR